MGNFIVVHFHADGGNTCIPGLRSWPNTRQGRQLAEQFAIARKLDSGHVCGPDAAWVEFASVEPKTMGSLWPEKSVLQTEQPISQKPKRKTWIQRGWRSLVDGMGVILTGLLISGAAALVFLLVKLVVFRVVGG